MSPTRTALFVCGVLLAASPPGYAGDWPRAKAAAEACARVIRTETGTGAYEVVKMTAVARQYQIWMNAHDGSVAAYCTTRRDQVTESFTRKDLWTARNPERPRTLDVAANCPSVATAD